MDTQNKIVSIIIMDKFAKRNIETSNLIPLLRERNYEIQLLDTSILSQSLYYRIVRSLKNKFYVILKYRFAEINQFKKHLAKKLHQKDKNVFKSDRVNKISGFPFPTSKRIFNILKKIYLKFPNDIKSHSIKGLVLLTNLQTPLAQSVQKFCQKNKLEIIGLINSWDHLTHNSEVISSPNVKKFLVWNEIQKEELKIFHGISPDIISIVGPLQFDILHKEKFDKEDIYRLYKINPSTKIIFLPAYNERLGPAEPKVIKFILDNSAKINEEFIVIIRPFPFDETFKTRFKRVIGNSRVIIAHLKNDIDEDRKNMSLLLRQSSVIISGAGTAAIEAMYYDTPIIHIGIDERDLVNNTSLNYKFFFSDHYARIMEKNPSFFVRDYPEIIDAINAYFKNPKLFSKERKEVIKEQIFFLDGKASERIANEIDSFFNS